MDVVIITIWLWL